MSDISPSPLSVVHRPPGGQATLLEADNRYHNLLSERFGLRFLRYRAAWAKAKNQRDPGDFPLSLDLAVNSGCQLSCLMCPLPARPRKITLMEQSLFLKLMEEAKNNELAALTFGLASEPLLHPDIVWYVETAVKAGVMDIRLGTNGRALTPGLIDDLIDRDLTRLEISLDALDEGTYRTIRPGGDYQALLKSVEYFLERREQKNSSFPLLRLSFLTLPQNDGQLKPFLERFTPLADLISIQTPIWFPGSQLPEDLGRSLLSATDEEGLCLQPWQRLGIDQSGHIWPCCSWYGENLLKMTAASESVASIWRSSALEGLRRDHRAAKLPSECLKCFQAGAF
jgi:radical SAM protein with 4Fe4S-binding SPASM domain